MFPRNKTLIGFFLLWVLIGGTRTAPVIGRERANENTPLDLVFDPQILEDHFTLVYDYGVKPVPPQIPSDLLRA